MLQYYLKVYSLYLEAFQQYFHTHKALAQPYQLSFSKDLSSFSLSFTEDSNTLFLDSRNLFFLRTACFKSLEDIRIFGLPILAILVK
jgi:hypothetical protein